MTHYSLGFLFQDDKVALIRKKRPEWQCGLLNGIGGHIEEDETAMEAMIREFREETGRTVTQWRYYCQMSSREFMVHVFTCHGYLDALKTMTDEKIVICDINNLHDTVPNLKWLIPLALDDIYMAAVRVKL